MHLPVRRISVPRQQWAKLSQDVWSNEFIEAYLIDEHGIRPIQLRYRGGHTREHSKKSFELRLGAQSIHLNAENDDPSMIRNALSFRFFEWIGVPSPTARHCTLRINEEDFGVYLEIEGVDVTFFRRRGLGCKALIYAVNDAADFSLRAPETNKLKPSLFDGYELIQGDVNDRRQFERFILHVNTLRGARLQTYLQSSIDIQNYFNWLSGAVCTNNYDGFTQNYAVVQSELDARYRMIPWDYEGTWGRNCFGERCSSRLVRVTGYNILTKKLLSFPVYRKQFRNTLQAVVETTFNLPRIQPEVENLLSGIQEQVSVDATRDWTPGTLEKERDIIFRYIKMRSRYLHNQLKCI